MSAMPGVEPASARTWHTGARFEHTLATVQQRAIMEMAKVHPFEINPYHRVSHARTRLSKLDDLVTHMRCDISSVLTESVRSKLAAASLVVCLVAATLLLRYPSGCALPRTRRKW